MELSWGGTANGKWQRTVSFLLLIYSRERAAVLPYKLAIKSTNVISAYDIISSEIVLDQEDRTIQ
jgi:hypothetical protein